MNTIDLIIKHKLWSLLKENNSTNMEENFLSYLFWNAKTDIIDQIKNDNIVENLLTQYITNDIPYKYEKRMFAYLKGNISQEKFISIINDYPHNYLLLQWTHRNKDKNPFLPFVDYLDSNKLEQGLFLYYASSTNNKKLIDYAINNVTTHIAQITEKSEINMLLSKDIKGESKLKLYTKFKHIISNDIVEYLTENIRNEDFIVSTWIIDHYYQQINNNDSKFLQLMSYPYNDIMEKLLCKNPELFLDKKNPMFCDNLFEKVFLYKNQKINTANSANTTTATNAIEETCNLFVQLGIKIPTRESELIFNRHATYDNIDTILDSKILSYNKDELINENLFEKLLKTRKQVSMEPIKDICEKLLIWDIKIAEKESFNILKKHVILETVDYLLDNPLFNYNIELLLHSLWKKNIELGIKIAMKMEKPVLWKYLESLPPSDRSKLELAYYDVKFDEKPKQKRLKI